VNLKFGLQNQTNDILEWREREKEQFDHIVT
jgi:hypothetical protein